MKRLRFVRVELGTFLTVFVFVFLLGFMFGLTARFEVTARGVEFGLDSLVRTVD